ncbi:cell division protein FtsQ/DivIB [Ectothiorhodospira sp. BSL-9]|uniref:cell division protein FtsQ/DivIB n=1 Tax=Ectothiorhodospira sp. BSL-9 TaxID=1442136 RepID=UPI0009EE5578|nr:cell division protein FtsQ/DivIB [Ectothiorhodospira sp. BSL-9]
MRKRTMARRHLSRPPWWRQPWLRRGLRLVWLGGAAVLLMALVIQGVERLLHPETLPVRSVVIEGDFQYLDRQAISETLVPYVSGGFFSLDLRPVERAVEAMPWVHGVSVRREWPDRLVVRVDEQVPVARWGETALLNQYGELFHPPMESQPEGLPALWGRAGRERPLMERYLAVQARLADVGLEVEGLKEDARRSWVIHLQDGSQVVMGRGMDTDRLDRLVRMYPRLTEHRDEPIKRIDMRYTNGIAVAWGEPAEALE